MHTSIKNINHEGLGKVGSEGADFTGVVVALQQVAKGLRDFAEKPAADIKVPFPEIHNEFVVPSPHIDFHAPVLENRVTVNPTPVEVTVSAPHVDNHVVCDPAVTLDVSRLVVPLYLLTGAIGLSSVGVILAIIFH